MRPRSSIFALALLAVSSGCGTAVATHASQEAMSADEAADRQTAFTQMRDALVQQAAETAAIRTVAVTVDETTDASVVTSIVPPKNANPDAHSATPANLQGTYWMRGNPLPDYLLSFANMRWTTVNGTPYGYLSTSAPGSFAWKEKVTAEGAAADDFAFLPEVCRVPKDDPTLNEIARHRTAHDETLYERPIAEDFAEMAAAPDDTVSEDDANGFIDAVWGAGQMALDGAQAVQVLNAAHVFYEAKFSADYNEASVIVFGLATWPNPAAATQLAVPEEVASFSFAPHKTDRNIFVRKSFIRGLSTIPNYYLLTRIVDGDGNPTPHFGEFIACAQARSQGRVLQVQLAQ